MLICVHLVISHCYIGVVFIFLFLTFHLLRYKFELTWDRFAVSEIVVKMSLFGKSIVVHGQMSYSPL